jgi:tetratricopeptide (TPR) repeat protein
MGHPRPFEELLVGTPLLAGDPGATTEVEELTGLTLQQLRSRARRGEDCSELLALLPLLETETRFGTPGAVPRWGAQAEALLRALNEGERIAVNFGALDCLHECVSNLDPAGFVLINDYGMVTTGGPQPAAVPQRFGRTVAVGLNFPLLERCLQEVGLCVDAPCGDEERGVHTRLVSKEHLPRTLQALALRFSARVEQELDAPVLAAREHAAAGRLSEALDAYRAALERTPKDWNLLGEIAEFVGLVVRDFSSGVEIARRATELNPWTSAWLWNVVGDCLYYLERYPDAHEAFLRAQTIDSADVRTNLNLAHTLGIRGQHEAALSAVARGLGRDAGAYRSRLLQQQEHLLNALANKRAMEQDRLARRLERLGSG